MNLFRDSLKELFPAGDKVNRYSLVDYSATADFNEISSPF